MQWSDKSICLNYTLSYTLPALIPTCITILQVIYKHIYKYTLPYTAMPVYTHIICIYTTLIYTHTPYTPSLYPLLRIPLAMPLIVISKLFMIFSRSASVIVASPARRRLSSSACITLSGSVYRYARMNI